MLLKLILIVAILYFIGRSIGNMTRAILGDLKAPPSPPPPPQPPREVSRQRPARPGHTDDEIEDAKWVDLE